jgi:hypothetical protein
MTPEEFIERVRKYEAFGQVAWITQLLREYDLQNTPFVAGDMFVQPRGEMPYVRNEAGQWRYWYDGQWRTAATTDAKLDEPDAREWSTIIKRGGVEL